MRINNTHQQSAELELHGFQQGIPHMVADMDWLTIRVSLIRYNDSYHVIDPSLTAQEVFILSKWLHDLGCGKPVKKDLYFWEPNLSFHLIHYRENEKTIKICFNAELKPKWLNKDEDYYLACRLTNEELTYLASGLFGDLQDLYTKAGYNWKDTREN